MRRQMAAFPVTGPPILGAPHFLGTVLGVLGVLFVLAKALVPRSGQAPTPATGPCHHSQPLPVDGPPARHFIFQRADQDRQDSQDLQDMASRMLAHLAIGNTGNWQHLHIGNIQRLTCAAKMAAFHMAVRRANFVTFQTLKFTASMKPD